MELTDDHQQADVIVVYLLNLGKALLVDKRRSADHGPLVDVLPQEEMLLEGKPVAPPLTPEAVHFIERLQVMPQQPGVFQSYMRQLVETMELKLAYMRPDLGPPQFISIGPHFAPVLLMANSDIWLGVIEDLHSRGEDDAVEQAREALKELYVDEVMLPERIDPVKVAELRRDFYDQQVFRPYSL